MRAIKKGWSGAKIFYDEFEKWNLWGQDLTSGLYDIYTRRSRRCLIVFSVTYLKKAWPKHELRAAYSRMVKDGVGYILPLLIDDSEPPKELETIAYVRLGETKIADVGQRLADMIFNDGYGHWLYENEAVELLSELLRFRIMTDEFRRGMIAASSEDGVARAILALMWASEKTISAVDRFWEYLVFEFEPLAKRFGAGDVYLAIPPHGYVARYISDHGPLRMPPGFGDPIFTRAKATNPLLAEDGQDLPGAE